jgi:serine/threonine-protein kinase
MPTPTPEEFWKLVADTGLVDHDQLEGLRREFGRESLVPGVAGDALTDAIAKWLVGRKVLTNWQARQLARGSRGPFLLGDYRLLERLDDTVLRTSGAKASLLRARHQPSGRSVCLVLLDPQACRRIEVWTDIVRRTAAAHEARNPITSRTWALEQAGPQRFIVCEDIVGPSLAEEFASRGPLPIAEAGPLMVAIAGALAELHRLGTVHGGLSLEAVRREAASGRVRLMQFPLVADPHAVPLRPPLDSPEEIRKLGPRACFIAPELLLPESRSDARSDVYALGCLFHSLLVGSPPCWQGDAERSLSQAAFVGPPPLGPPQVPIEVATLISYMVARDPAARYPTAAEAADAIAVCLGMPPVSPTLPPQRPAIAAGAAIPEPAPPQATVPVAAANGSTAQLAKPAFVPQAAATRKQRPWWSSPLAAVGLAVILVGAVVPLVYRPRPAASPPKPVPAKAVDQTIDKPAVDKPAAPSADSKPEVAETEEQAPRGPEAIATAVNVVDSDTLPWASPTSGPPPTLAYLPSGSQLILLARPADILASDEGRLFLRALGPRAAEAVTALAAIGGCPIEGIETVQGGWQAGGPDEVIGGYAIRGRDVLPVAADASLREAWGATTEKEQDGETLFIGRPLSFWLPTAEAGKVLVAAPELLLAKIVATSIERRAARESGGPADWRQKIEAVLPPDLEDLVGMLDESRCLTLFGSPHYLLYDGRPILAGPFAKLVDPLGEFFGREVRAAALSLHFGKATYLEIDCRPPAGTTAARLAKDVAAKVESLADTVEEYCNALDPHPYGRKLVMRLPRMLTAVTGSLRSGGEGRGAVVNCLLPEHAAHNLTLAAELAIQQQSAATAARTVASPAAAPASAADRLQRKLSLVFPSDTLEKTVRMIAEEIGLPIEIRGKDLELDGITKNQSFGLDAQNQTADAILRTILARSNPDGKLVYVVRNKGGAESIEITTRAAAAKRGDTLPPGFEEDTAGGESPDKPEKEGRR